MSVANEGYLDARLVKRVFLESIEIMGKDGKRIFLEELQVKGLDLDESKFSFTSLTTVLRKVFGDDATDVITQNIMFKIDEMCSAPLQRSGYQTTSSIR